MSSVKTETQSKTKVLKISAKVVRNDTKTNIDTSDESFHLKETEVNNNEESIEKPAVFKPKIVWFNAIGFLILHIAAAYGVLLMLFKAKFLTIIWCKSYTTYLNFHFGAVRWCTLRLYPLDSSVSVMACVSGLATTMGAHRLYAHRTYKANKWIRLALVTFQTLAGQVKKNEALGILKHYSYDL